MDHQNLYRTETSEVLWASGYKFLKTGLTCGQTVSSIVTQLKLNYLPIHSKET